MIFLHGGNRNLVIINLADANCFAIHYISYYCQGDFIMLKDRDKLYQAYHTILSMALTWALALAVSQYYTLKVPVLIAAVFSVVPALLIYLFNLNRKSVISYILLGSILPLLALIFWITSYNPFHSLAQFIRWCSVYDGSAKLYKAGYADFAVFGTALLGTIAFHLLMKNSMTKIILAAVLLTAMIAFSIGKTDVNKAVVGIIIFYILTVVIELYGSIYAGKSGRTDKREGILYLAPVCLLLAVLAVSLPSKPEPIQWKVIKNAYHGIRNQIETWQSDYYYYFGKSDSELFSLSGYSEDSGDLTGSGNKITKNEKVALKVSGLETDASVYLTGSISNVYTGHSWERSSGSYLKGQKDYLLDYKELFCALARQNLNVLKNNRFVERNNLHINYDYIKTRTFFYPLKTSSYEIYSKNRKLSLNPAQITFNRLSGKGTSYQCTFFEMNLQGKAFQQMLRNADSFSYQNAGGINQETVLWLEGNQLFGSNTTDLSMNEDTYKVLAKRSELIRAQYTALPSGLPDRVSRLAEEITADYDTTYDKLKAIEAYLMKYHYSLANHKVPEGEDYTDYFLFESKEGYCTSFATAMAVLGRCIGVPTRYVEGFVARFNGSNEEGMNSVRNSQAHAWAEAYIEGVGWIPFEATAPYYDNRYTKWSEISQNSGTAGTDYRDQMDYDTHNLKKHEADESSKAAQAKNTSNDLRNTFLIFLAAVICLLLSAILYYVILRHRYRKAYEKADYGRKMYMLFLRILRLLKREGFVLEQQETILMLSKRVKDRYCYEHVTFTNVADIFMRYRYAEIEITKAELNKTAVFYRGLAAKQKEEVSRFRLLFEELIFLAKKGNC